MEAIDGVPLRDAPPGDERVEAARQLLESYCAQVLVDGFFHADPHPGNLLWRDGRIYFLDLGMVGELDSDLRAKVILLLLAFWRGDAEFLGDVLMMLSDEQRATPVDREALTAELAAAIERFGGDSLAEMEIGAMLIGHLRGGDAAPDPPAAGARAERQGLHADAARRRRSSRRRSIRSRSRAGSSSATRVARCCASSTRSASTTTRRS